VTNPSPNGPQWTGIARRLLHQAPDPEAVLDALVTQFTPDGGWTGSMATMLEEHLPLLDALTDLPQLANAIGQQKERLRKAIDEYRKSEATFSQQHDQRFE
jgi:hypothetical protein